MTLALTLLPVPVCAQDSPDDSLRLELSDSLVHVYYVKQGSVHSMSYDMEVERFTSAVSDEEFVRRLRNMNSFIPLSYNDIVKNYCILYSERQKSLMEEVIGQCEFYWPIFNDIFSYYGLPLELRALAIIESRLRPTATSRMGAKGPWQFMYRTARGYGLRIDSWMDERMDPVRSTIAAARYLKNAYEILGDWQLAIASYNCGLGNVSKAINRSGGKRDFWDIYPYLPRETRGYLPAFMGALYTLHYYKEYGIVPRKAAIAVPVDTFHIRKQLHFEQIAAVVGVPKETVAQLNPQYLHEIVPGQEYPCILRLPMKFSNAFIEAGDSLYTYDTTRLFNPVTIKKIKEGGSGNAIVYKVKSGDVLGKIARRYGVSVAQIKKWNHLKSDNIRIGQKLTIYK